MSDSHATAERLSQAYRPGQWFLAATTDEMEAFYVSRLPAIREAARVLGYALGQHGSMRRDMDLIGVPWREGAGSREQLARGIAMAACGLSRTGPYEWEAKPCGRYAVSFPICWTAWHDMVSAGHIDLSVVDPRDRDAALRGMAV